MRARWIASLSALAAVPLFVGLGTAADAPPPVPASRPATQPADAKPYFERVPGTAVAFAMTPIPGGRFRMGSPDGEKGRKKDEGPQVDVEMEPFHMAVHEVDWASYVAFTDTYAAIGRDPKFRPVPHERLGDAVSYPTPIYDVEAGPIIQRMGGRAAGYPAVSVSRLAAKQYTKWLSKKTGRFYRLPTEAEWEYAARAGSTTAYAFGDDPKRLSDHGWFVDNSELPDGDPGCRKVGLRPSNAWGLFDMHGNVGEWVIDRYDAGWYATLAAKGRPVRWDEAVNWPSTRYPGVIRGGGYESEAADCRSAARFRAGPGLNANDPYIPKSPYWESSAFWVGFRVVSPAREPTEAEKRRYWDAEDPETVEDLKRDREIREIVEPPAKPTTREAR